MLRDEQDFTGGALSFVVPLQNVPLARVALQSDPPLPRPSSRFSPPNLSGLLQAKGIIFAL